MSFSSCLNGESSWIPVEPALDWAAAGLGWSICAPSPVPWEGNQTSGASVSSAGGQASDRNAGLTKVFG